MKYNLTEVFENAGKVVTESFPLEYDAVSIRGEEYTLTDASDVVVTATNIEKGKANVKCEFNADVLIPCDRCLEPVKTEITVSSENVFYSPENSEQMEEEAQFMDGYKLDVDELILSEILLEWPNKILCRDDCKGICTVCGKNLNEGECGCDRFVPNPAFAGLSELFKFD